MNEAEHAKAVQEFLQFIGADMPQVPPTLSSAEEEAAYLRIALNKLVNVTSILLDDYEPSSYGQATLAEWCSVELKYARDVLEKTKKEL